jgi:hypothetical protein
VICILIRITLGGTSGDSVHFDFFLSELNIFSGFHLGSGFDYIFFIFNNIVTNLLTML